MFDMNKKERICKISISDLITVLDMYDPEATVYVDGNSSFWIHSEKDGSYISFDTESMDEEYEGGTTK